MTGRTGPLTGRRVLISGGSSGIGNGIARGLFEAGASVTILSRRPPREWERLMPADWPVERCWLPADFTRLEEVIPRLERWLEEDGRGLDVLVHSAVTYGSNGRRPLREMHLEEWDRVFAVGPRAYFTLVRAVLPRLLERPRALILSLSSEVAFNAGPGRIDYAASKAAARNLSLSLAQELAGTGISVVDLLPEGMVDTPGIRRRRRTTTELAGYATPDSFIPAACRLVASLGEGLSGTCLVVPPGGDAYPFDERPAVSQTRDADLSASAPASHPVPSSRD
ncbi:SDR family oxidoreductase [Archangium violaceum]|uniref:SDR family NAD(P)-dependent oxidoreductase n=1 Tax=Archangium violaceum TaxID=83451 RepID=UPI00193B4DC8|nr:SDR family oxidoreductase [Archangium violaceum]QRK10074.1 SDR family oxidoreductase [Archangium violaceum]